MGNLLTDDMDIRDTELSIDAGGNGDYYLSLKETKRGKIIKLDTRIAMSGGNATTEVKLAVANLYRALQGQPSHKESSGLRLQSVVKVEQSEATVICPNCDEECLPITLGLMCNKCGYDKL